jgi:hypothetical protein
MSPPPLWNSFLTHFYRDVPGLGNVAVSRHAQERLEQAGVTPQIADDVMMTGDTIPDGHDTIFRQKHGVRFVIIKRPTPFRGAALATTAFRIESPKRL